MKIGLIGGGNISNTHAKAGCAIAGVEIVAVYGTNSGKVNQLSRDHGAVPYSDFAAFLAHPMDMVIVGGPSGLHASQVLPRRNAVSMFWWKSRLTSVPSALMPSFLNARKPESSLE